MKKSVFEALHSYLNGDNTVDLALIVSEVNAEWYHMNEKRNANRNVYETAKSVVFGVMSDTPMTVKEIFAACENDLPDGFTANKIQYALLHYWNDETVKHDNGKSANTYSLK